MPRRSGPPKARRRLAGSKASLVRGSGGALFFVLLARPATAQVNVERLRGDLRDAPATATLEGTFAGRAGNVQNVVAGAAAIGGARWRRHRFFTSLTADYARLNGITGVSKSFIHLRYEYVILPWLSAELFVQQQQDKFQRLQLRELVGAGPRFTFYNEEDLRLTYGTAYMFEYERISMPENAPDEPRSFAQRWSNYVGATWQADSRVRLLGTLYAQPKFNDFGDIRILFEAALTTDITKRLSVKVLGTLRYDSQPPTDVKNLDLEIKNSIALKF